MNIARIRSGQTVMHAVVENDGYRPISGPLFGEWHPGDTWVPRHDAQLLAPLAPPQVVAIGLNYREHAAESGAAIPTAPVLFLKSPTAIIGPEAPIVLPAMAPDEVDYEAELVIVTGRHARNVPPEAADRYILGYTCGNDVSARDCQHRLDVQWARAKSFDTFAPIGPVIATGIDPDRLDIRLRLNETVMQSSNTADMLFSCRTLFSYVSRCMTLLPGSVIFTGTPPGVGCARTPPVFLKAGDRVGVEIESIGALENPVVREAAP